MGWKEGGSRRIWDDVMWHRPCEGGGFVFIMVDEVLNLDHESLSKPLRYFWCGVQKQPFYHSPSTMPPLSQLICAYCRVWSLEVGFERVESYGYGGDQGIDDEGGEEGSYE